MLTLMGNACFVPATREAAPNAWKRYAAFMIDTFRADRAHPLPPPLSPKQMYRRWSGPLGADPRPEAPPPRHACPLSLYGRYEPGPVGLSVLAFTVPVFIYGAVVAGCQSAYFLGALAGSVRAKSREREIHCFAALSFLRHPDGRVA